MKGGSVRRRAVASTGAATAALLTISACTTFATVRSAEVTPGPSLGVQASYAGRPGPEAGWFWAFDCAQECDHPVWGVDLGLSYGWVGADTTRRPPVAVGVGVSGFSPYADGYVQLRRGRRPLGVGARVGLPIGSWMEHQLYARYDVPLGTSARVLLNPALFVHHGNSPNGQNPGTFVAFVQGVGVEVEGPYVSLMPSVALVAGHTRRSSYGRRVASGGTAFGTASLRVTFHRRRRGAR